MTKKQGIRAVLFLLLLSAALSWCNAFPGMPKTDDVILMTRRFKEMRTDVRDTWDGIVIGTSIADRSWAAPLAYEQYGMAVYPMSTDGQPFVLSENLIEEVRKYQDVSFVAVELHGIRTGALKTNGSRVRWITDHMQPSINRIKTITKALHYMDRWYPGAFDASGINRLSYYLPFLKFHTRLTTDVFHEGDFCTGETKMKGVYEAERHSAVKELEPAVSEVTSELDGQQKELIDELISYAKEKELELVFYVAPSKFKEDVLAQLNGAVQYVRSRGIEVVDFHDPQILAESGINGEEDFIDAKHLNIKGARKLTMYLAAWLHEELELPDHRGETSYESWEQAASAYEAFYEQSAAEMSGI